MTNPAPLFYPGVLEFLLTVILATWAVALGVAFVVHLLFPRKGSFMLKLVTLCLLALAFLAPVAYAHETFVWTNHAPLPAEDEPGIFRVAPTGEIALAAETTYPRHAAVWDATTERLLTLGGGYREFREYEERDVTGALVGQRVTIDGAIPYRVEGMELMGPRRVIGWGWGPNWPNDWRLFTFIRSDPEGTVRTFDVSSPPAGMVCLRTGRIVVPLANGDCLVRDRGLPPRVMPLYRDPLWISHDGERLWFSFHVGGLQVVENEDDPPEEWVFEAVDSGEEGRIIAHGLVSTGDGHTIAYSFAGVYAFVGTALTTHVPIPLQEVPSRPRMAIGPGHRLWFSRAPIFPDARGYVCVTDWFAAEGVRTIQFPGRVEGIAALAAGH